MRENLRCEYKRKDDTKKDVIFEILTKLQQVYPIFLMQCKALLQSVRD